MECFRLLFEQSRGKDPKRYIPGISPLLFLIAMMPLTHILRKCTAGYKLSKSQEIINHLMYMEDIKLFAKNEKELKTLIQIVKIFIQDIEMEFGIEKCAMLVMKRGKRHMTERIERPNQEKKSKRSEKRKPINISEYWKLTPSNKWKWKKKFKSITEKPKIEPKLYFRSLVKEINTWAIPLVRFSGTFLKWTREEL